jgi:addiction module HigA family antidote
LSETLEAKGISQSELSMRTGLSEKTISQVINGVAPITHESALKLECALGVPARFWNNLESNYREAKARLEQTERLAEDTRWLETIPIRVLIERSLIKAHKDRVELLREVLAFFGVCDVEAWHKIWAIPDAAFRRASRPRQALGRIATWLRIGELAAQQIPCDAYDPQRFRQALGSIRGLSVQSPDLWLREIVRQCAAAGVAAVFVPEIPGAGVSGATRWLTKDKALIQLSLLYKNDATFWFTFFHEAGHVLLHGKKEVFLEDGRSGTEEKEVEADRFARDFLIPRERARELPTLRTRPAISAFAASLDIAPGLVVGRLQHDQFVYPSAFNDLKRKVTWQ